MGGAIKGPRVSVSYTHLDVYKRQALAYSLAVRPGRFPNATGVRGTPTAAFLVGTRRPASDADSIT